MGMDAVELIMRVEEEFDIEISDAEAGLLSTPGMLSDFVAYKLGPSKNRFHSSGCPTSRAFYAVRRALMQMGVERKRITPQTSLAELWPRSERRQQWSALEDGLKYELPALCRSPEWTFIALLLIGVLPVWLAYSPSSVGPVCALYAIVWWVGFHVTEPFATYAPKEMRTVADLSRRLVPRFCDSSSTSAHNIWQQVRRIIADEFNLPIEQVTRDADFYRDLGLS